MINVLQDFGLSEKEAQVYSAALEIGRATADQLAKHSKIKRSTTYVQIESLMKKGLMSTFEEGKKTYFAPESPEQLRRIFEKSKQELEQKKIELDSLLPELIQLFVAAGERPVVRFYDGKEGITTMREYMLSTKSKEFLTIYSQDNLNDLFPEDERLQYSQKRIDAGITSKLIYTHTKGEISLTKTPALTHRKFVPAEKLPIKTDIVVFDYDQVALSALRGRPFGIVIQSKEIADSLRAIFNLLWENV